VLVKNLFDTIEFIKKEISDDNFILDGNFGCETHQNIIYKAYLSLIQNCDNYQSNQIKEFFNTHKIKVDKHIPEFAGLGGGSSNGARFLNMTNDILELGFSKDELAKIGAKFGADVPFFVYDYNSANVSGIGEIVEEFVEDELDIEVYTPNIKCETPAIFKEFGKNFYKECQEDEIKRLFALSSKEAMKTMSIEEANELYPPAKSIYKDLLPPDNSNIKWFFSGSGSSFFKI
jgi:4-diphosphocytidyl-2-C-methyl-D-erythritol kinase